MNNTSNDAPRALSPAAPATILQEEPSNAKVHPSAHQGLKADDDLASSQKKHSMESTEDEAPGSPARKRCHLEDEMDVEEQRRMSDLSEQYAEQKNIQDKLRTDTMKIIMLLNSVKASLHCKRSVQRLVDTTRGVTPAASSAVPAHASMTTSHAATASTEQGDTGDAKDGAEHPVTAAAAMVTNPVVAKLTGVDQSSSERQQFAALLKNLMLIEMKRKKLQERKAPPAATVQSLDTATEQPLDTKIAPIVRRSSGVVQPRRPSVAVEDVNIADNSGDDWFVADIDQDDKST